MIKALLHQSGGRKLLVLGFSAMNARKLLEQLPIVADLEEAGLPGLELLVMGGETEQDMIAELEEKLGIKVPDEMIVQKGKPVDKSAN